MVSRRLIPASAPGAKLETYLAIMLLAAAAVAVFGRLYAVGNAEMTVWGDRDLWRALDAFRQWPVLGPETNGGAQTPGGAFYLLLAGFLAVHPGVMAANAGVVVCFAASILVLWAAFAREVSPLAGALVAAAFAGSGLLADNLGLWNPGYLDLFAAAATVAGYRFISHGRAVTLGVATAALALGMQVHLQMVELAIGLAVAVAIFRPRLNWRCAAAFGLGLVVPYLPALMSGSGRTVLAALALPGDAVGAYVFANIHPMQKAGLLLHLLGGSSTSFATTAVGRWPWAANLLAVADLLAAALAVAFLLRLMVRRWRGTRPPAFGVFAVIAVVYLAVALVAFVNARHLVALVPAIAAMIGLSAELLVTRLRRSGRFGAVATCCICALIAVRPAVLGASQLLPQPFSITSTRAREEIAGVLKAGFYADRESFENHAALFWHDPDGRWQMVQGGVSNRMSFIYRTAPVTPASIASDSCIAIINKAEIAGDPRPALAASPAFTGFGAAFAPAAAAVESPHFVYLPYITRDGNCLKTFANAYLPTKFETTHLPPGTAAGAQADGMQAVFVAPQPGHNFPLGVAIRREGESYVAELHGRLLRGYTGLYFRTIVAPALCLRGANGITVVSFGRVTVGSPQRGTLAPWRSPRFALAEGRYDVWLTGQDGRQPIHINEKLGWLAVPAFAAGPPDAVSPPGECAAARIASRQSIP